jgi:hypothetical protein
MPNRRGATESPTIASIVSTEATGSCGSTIRSAAFTGAVNAAGAEAVFVTTLMNGHAAWL